MLATCILPVWDGFVLAFARIFTILLVLPVLFWTYQVSEFVPMGKYASISLFLPFPYLFVPETYVFQCVGPIPSFVAVVLLCRPPVSHVLLFFAVIVYP
jgi:hypothetical protein